MTHGKNFFEEIVEGVYNYHVIPKQEDEIELSSNEIEVIHLGDTRHIAICSMMLQGMNELTIAQLAGHKTLTEQIGYCSHLESYARAYTYTMAKAFQNKINLNSDQLSVSTQAKKMLITRALLNDELESSAKNSPDYCLSKNFPFECEIDDCLFCHHYVGNKDMSKEMLSEKGKLLDQEIDTRINYIKAVVSNQTHFKDAEATKTNSKALNTLLKRKAIVEAYMME